MMKEEFVVVKGGERVFENGVKDDDESPCEHILEEMESFFVDIDDRLIMLIISRMVSDSVIKGMVNAVEEQAAERIAQKESEVVGLKKKLSSLCVGSDEAKMMWSSVCCNETHEGGTRRFLDGVMEKDRVMKPVGSLKFEIHELLSQLKKEINKVRGLSSTRRFSSGSDLVGLGGILQENVPERWIYVDKAFESLKDAMDSFCKRIGIRDRVSKATTLSEWQEEQEFRLEIERMVIRNCIRSLQQEIERKLCDVCESESRNSFNQYKEISSLRQDLDSIFRTLSVTGTLISHGSLEHTDDWSHNKRADHVHLKLSTDHSTASTLEENGKHGDSKISKPDNLDSGSLKDMTKDDLITYITKMRRNHESQVQEKTEENFRLRRELLNLKERGSSFSLKKDKDFDLLKKKIPDAISKLNEILDGNEKLRQFSENIESLCSFKDRLDFLQSENHQLKDMLTDKNKELKSLSSQLSVSMEKLLQQQLTEENLLRTVQKLEDDIGDAHFEVSVIQDVYKCFVEDIESECRFITEDLRLKYDFMQEIYEVMLKVTVDSAQASNGLEIEEANFEDRLDFLQSENHQLKDMLTDKNKELKSLSSQLSVSMEKLLQQQLTEENLLRTVQKLEDDIEDAHVEVSVIQDVYKCFVEDIESECRFITEDLQLKYDFMEEIYEVMLNVTVDSAQASNGLEIEEANFESIMMQGLLDINQIIFKGALVGADEALKSEAAEKNKLKYEIFMLKSTVEEKENLLQGATDALEQEKRKMEAASEQFDSLRTKTDLQHQWMVENSKELDVTKGNLIAATKEIEQYKEQMQKLHRNLEQGVNELREVDKERRELCAVTKKQQDALKCIEAKERETRKQMDSTINLIHKLLTMVNDVEASVNEDISRNRMRLESMSSEFSFLKNKASALKTMGLVYKQRFETKSSDLAKAEAEEGMVEFIGMLKVKVIKGTDLAVRDIKSSDPYVVLNLGTQTVQTSVMKSNLNPVWNEEHMLSVPEHYGQLKLKVFDHDTFSADDIMGEADIDLQSLITSAMAFGDAGMFGDMQIGKWLKSDDNALIEDSAVKIIDGKVKQMMTLKLQNVESGEIELELEWISLDH